MYRVIQNLLKHAESKPNGDKVDRLNYSTTSNILFLIIILICIKQYVGSPIQCWIPAEFQASWETYIERYCFIQNTYYVSEKNLTMPSKEEKPNYELRYYQWVPVFLSVQLALFILTKNFWSFASESTGLDVKSVLVHCPLPGYKKEELPSNLAYFGRNIYARLQFASELRGKFLGLIPHNSYFTFTYLCYKLLSCLNVFFQLWMMNRYLNTEYNYLWGFEIFKDLIFAREWKASGHFPRVTFCDFIRRDETSSAPISFPVQCVLMINMFNEKIYIILWFWFILLAVVNLISTVYWFITSLSSSFRKRCIEDMLKYMKVQYTHKQLEEFIATRIYMDGLLAIRLVACNAGDQTAAGIVEQMFYGYLKKLNEAGSNESGINWKNVNLLSSGFNGRKRDSNGSSGGDSGYGGGGEKKNEDLESKINEIFESFDMKTAIKCSKAVRKLVANKLINPADDEQLWEFLQSWNLNSSTDTDDSDDDDSENYEYKNILGRMFLSFDEERKQKLLKYYKQSINDPNYDDDDVIMTIEDLCNIIDTMGPIIEAEHEKFIRQQTVSAQKSRVAKAVIKDEKLKAESAKINLPTKNDPKENDKKQDQPLKPPPYHKVENKSLSKSKAAPSVINKCQKQQEQPFYQDPVFPLFNSSYIKQQSDMNVDEKDCTKPIRNSLLKSNENILPTMPMKLPEELTNYTSELLAKFGQSIKESVPAASEAAPKPSENSSIKVLPAPTNFGMKSDDSTVVSEAVSDHINVPSRLRAFMDKSASELKVADEIYLPKSEKPVTTFVKTENELEAAAPKPSDNSSIKPVTTQNVPGTKNADATVISEAVDHDNISSPLPTFENLDKSDSKPSVAARTSLPKTEKLKAEIGSEVTAPESHPKLTTSKDSLLDPAKNDTVAPEVIFDNVDIPAVLQKYMNLDNPVPVSTVTDAIACPKIDELVSTPPNLDNDENPTAQKSISEVEATVGFLGSGVWEGFKNFGNSLFGAWTPATKPEVEDSVSSENDENVNPLFDDSKIVKQGTFDTNVEFEDVDEEFGTVKDEFVDGGKNLYQPENYGIHGIEPVATFINDDPKTATDKNVNADIEFSKPAEDDVSVTKRFADKNYESLESAKLKVGVAPQMTTSDSVSESNKTSDADEMKLNTTDNLSINQDDAAVDFDANFKGIQAAHENIDSFFEKKVIDPMPSSSDDDEIFYPVP